MAAIATITFNPALDKSVSIPELISERKLKCSVPVYEPGGGGINVARAIKKLGGEAVALYLAGGSAGQMIGELLSGDGVPSIAIDRKANTRENLIVTDLATRKQYLFDMPGSAVLENEWQKCLAALGKLDNLQYIVVSGSMPGGLPPDIFQRLSHIATQKKAKLIADTSGEALRQAVEAGVYLVKPNLKELGLLTNREDLTAGDAAKIARRLIAEYPVEVVVVSLGALGALLVTDQFSITVSPPDVKIASTVGAGDSLVGGIVYYLSLGKDIVDAVKFGVACGSAATLNFGTELCTKVDAERIYQAVQTSGQALCNQS
ncbi:MAG: 1-phosphofructokinase family hexose kinase [Bacteroidetes bacterium]|nr:1-phosphofructokinase family hexose kinase [Bacteroidota bacterium]